MKLFISHSEKDRNLVDDFVDLLFVIGLKKEDIFYSSDPDLGVPNGENIYDYLAEMLDSELYVLFMLSDNYYNSVACLNEMGAVWVKRTKYMTFLLPGFGFQEINGAIDPRQISIKLDDNIEIVKTRLNMFKDDLKKIFGCSISESRWEKKRDLFLDTLKSDMNINLKGNVETYCIGDNLINGCELFLNTNTKIGVQIDFTKTDSDLCSAVIFPPRGNWHSFFLENRSILFEISATNVIQNFNLEFKFPKRNIKHLLEVDDELKEIKIPLNEICSKEEYWKNVLEICILVKKDDVDTQSTVYIQNFRIE